MDTTEDVSKIVMGILVVSSLETEEGMDVPNAVVALVES